MGAGGSRSCGCVEREHTSAGVRHQVRGILLGKYSAAPRMRVGRRIRKRRQMNVDVRVVCDRPVLLLRYCFQVPKPSAKPKTKEENQAAEPKPVRVSKGLLLLC